jgi:spermidine synthase
VAKIEILKQNQYNFLWIDDYLWMWDIPVEQQAQKELSDKSHGDVLVVGYGLGIVQKYLSYNPLVTSVTTIEQLSDLIPIVEKTYGKLYGDIVIADFFDYQTEKKYDIVIGDVWEDIAPLALGKYNQFEKQARNFLKTDGKVLAWGQEFFEALNAIKD